jgi:hypothetical protein
MTSCHFLGWGFCFAKPQALVTAGLHAGLKHPHPCGFSPYGVFAAQKLLALETAGLLPAHPVIFGLGVFAEQKPRKGTPLYFLSHSKIQITGWRKYVRRNSFDFGT